MYSIGSLCKSYKKITEHIATANDNLLSHF